MQDGEITEEDKHILLDIMGAALAQRDGNQEQLAANFGAYEDFDAKWELGKYFAELDKLLGRANAIMDRFDDPAEKEGSEPDRITTKLFKRTEALSKLPAEQLTAEDAEYVRRVQKAAFNASTNAMNTEESEKANELQMMCTEILKKLDK